jgi:DNA-binding transcriptional LysR family regulator
LSLPSLDSLRCFVEAARSLNFRVAARAVALTPAALGKRIAQLEDDFGRPLFHRTTRRVTLTQAGLDLLPRARQALDAAESCLQAGRGELAPVASELTLGTRYELGLSWVAPMLPRLRAEHSGLTIHLYFGSGADLLTRLRTLELSCAIGSMRVLDPRIEGISLHREDYVLVGATNLSKRAPLRRLADLARHTLIDATPELPLFAYLRDASRENVRLGFRSVLYMGTGAAVLRAVLLGEGVAVLPRYLVAPHLKDRQLQRLLPRAPMFHDYFRLLFRKDDPRRSLYQMLARTMTAVPLA